MKNFIRILTPFFYGSDRAYARWTGALLLLLSQLSTSFGYFYIQWNKNFYDALESRNTEQFFHELLVFTGLTLAFITVSSSMRFLSQQYALRWRIWMTKHALSFWLHSDTRGEIEGCDQRIQEDLMRFTTIFERFFIDCCNSVILILLFTPMMFAQTYHLRLSGFNLAWVLFIAVLIYTAVGMLISIKIAKPLVQYEYDNQKIEAEFRYNLVHVRDGAFKTTSFFDEILHRLTNNYNITYNRQKYFNFWQNGYNQFSFVLLFALLGSNYFAGFITFGAVMQIKSTFSRIRNAMAYLLDHYPELTELMAISRRLLEFYEAAILIKPNSLENSTILTPHYFPLPD